MNRLPLPFTSFFSMYISKQKELFFTSKDLFDTVQVWSIFTKTGTLPVSYAGTDPNRGWLAS